MSCCEPDSRKPEQKNSEPAPGRTQDRVGIAKTSLVLGLALVLVAGMFFGFLLKPSASPQDPATMVKSLNLDQQRDVWIAVGDGLKADLAAQGEYDCCILNPCNYCLYEEGECSCRQDILAGRHPCGECIGEILEGKGLPKLKPYYAKAIAHKVGARHQEHLEGIINDIYSEVQEVQ